MVVSLDLGNVKVYTVNGPAAGSSSSLPDWLTRKRAAAKGSRKRVTREYTEGTIELIQGFEFPEASIRIKTTRDGHHAIATGTYKPQMKVWDLDQLSQKFERHSDAENVDFIILSDDWTKSIHLQNDRTIELHTQSGFHHRIRIPRFGRSLAYHFPSCDAFFSASGNEIYRLSLDQGRFLNPLVLEDDEGGGDILGVNTIDVNPVHQLLAFGVEGNGSVQFWDPRSRTRVGILRLPKNRLLPMIPVPAATLPGVQQASISGLSVTAISSRADGLSYAVGTSSGHTLLYDIRSARPFALKDQGYGLPLKNVMWIDGDSRMAGDGLVVSADKKVIKIWDRSEPSTNFASITPAADLNHIHHVPGSGLFMTANEGIQMATYYIPQLGPAPRWASFLENITEEMEDQTVRTVYEDYKFVERNELNRLGLDHLVGTPALKPYMHGYFLSLKLYDTARVIANPFAYAEYREKMIKEKLDKMADTRIRTRKDAGVKVNKALADKIIRDEERARKRAEKRHLRISEQEQANDPTNAQDDQENQNGSKSKPNLLNDPRFAQLFEDPAFSVDEASREYALMNPSAATQRGGKGRTKTAVEEEEEDSDKLSSDGLGSSESEHDSKSDSGSDSSDAGELNKFDPRARPGQQNQRAREAYARNRESNRVANVNLVPLHAHAEGTGNRRASDQHATFGQRRDDESNRRKAAGTISVSGTKDGGMEMSWVSSSMGEGDGESERVVAGSQSKASKARKGVETFGAGMERGGEYHAGEINGGERKGRTQRRKGMRSGSKNALRMSG